MSISTKAYIDLEQKRTGVNIVEIHDVRGSHLVVGQSSGGLGDFNNETTMIKVFLCIKGEGHLCIHNTTNTV